MNEIEQTLFALNNLMQTKKQIALNQRDQILAEQTAMRYRWRGG